MNPPDDKNTAPNRLRAWWLSPPRSGIQLLIAPYEYRHLRGFGATRIFGGCIAAGAGLICLSYSAYAWAAFFGAIGALNLAGGWWFLSIDRGASTRA